MTTEATDWQARAAPPARSKGGNQDMTQALLLIRGLPGSGKSTIARAAAHRAGVRRGVPARSGLRPR